MGRENSGKATAAKMTDAEKKERSKKGVEARRYKASLPRARYEGELSIGGSTLPVAVIEGDVRVVKQSAVFEALDRPSRGNARLINIPTFMDAKNLQPLVSDGLRAVINKIEYVDSKGNIQSGYDANILPLVADLYLKARESGVLHKTQIQTAQKAEILVRALSQVGIMSLVDEATGYQDAREKDAMAKVFEVFVAKELQDWIKTFPDDYYKELFRLYELPEPLEGNVKRPQFFGRVTNKVIYKKLAPEILPELKARAKKLGSKNAKLHQILTPDKGHPELLKLVSSVTTIMKLSKTREEFFDTVDKIHPDFNENYNLDL